MGNQELTLRVPGSHPRDPRKPPRAAKAGGRANKRKPIPSAAYPYASSPSRGMNKDRVFQITQPPIQPIRNPPAAQPAIHIGRNQPGGGGTEGAADAWV